jgi:secreted trypsin-like serine protease
MERSCLICSISGGKKTELEFLIASGDSGGGLFLDGKLAGINSFVSAEDGKTNSSYGDESGHTRISLYREWIERETSE